MADAVIEANIPIHNNVTRAHVFVAQECVAAGMRKRLQFLIHIWIHISSNRLRFFAPLYHTFSVHSEVKITKEGYQRCDKEVPERPQDRVH